MTQNQLRVVIAEDEALIRLDLKEMLEEEGYSVVAEAGDGEAAVEHVTTLKPDQGLVLGDNNTQLVLAHPDDRTVSR